MAAAHDGEASSRYMILWQGSGYLSFHMPQREAVRNFANPLVFRRQSNRFATLLLRDRQSMDSSCPGAIKSGRWIVRGYAKLSFHAARIGLPTMISCIPVCSLVVPWLAQLDQEVMFHRAGKMAAEQHLRRLCPALQKWRNKESAVGRTHRSMYTGKSVFHFDLLRPKKMLHRSNGSSYLRVSQTYIVIDFRVAARSLRIVARKGVATHADLGRLGEVSFTPITTFLIFLNYNTRNGGNGD